MSVIAILCTIFVVLLLAFCNNVSEVAKGVRIPPPPSYVARILRAMKDVLRSYFNSEVGLS